MQNYNLIIDVTDVSSGSGAITEPVTVQEVKDYIRLEGFQDADESTSESLSDFDFDDTLIGEIITAVREKFEADCGFHLVPKTLEVTLTNYAGRIELPGPHGTDTVTAVDENGDDISDLIETVGTTWKYLKAPRYADMVLTYDCGYGTTGGPTLPKAIKIDILRCCAFYYLNRGEEDRNKFVSTLVVKYSRNSWLV